jgi:hypothetical protein
MKPQFIIITILIVLKVIGVASRANAQNYIPGYTCDNSTIFQINCGESLYEGNKVSVSFDVCNTEPEFQYINTFNNPTYRCGNTPKFVRI